LNSLIALVKSILIPAFSAAGGVGLLVLVFRSYLLDKIKASIQHDYDLKLESHRNALNRDAAAQLEHLRQSNSQQMAVQNAAFATFQASHGAAFERRLSAVDAVWAGFLDVTEKIPPALTWLDVFVEKEYPQILTKARVESVVRDLSDNCDKQLLALSQTGSRHLESSRPFVDPRLYALFYVHRAILGRIILVTKEGYAKGSIPYWPRDSLVKHYLEVVLSTEQLAAFKTVLVGPYAMLRGILEENFLALAQRIALGQESTEQILKESTKIRTLLGIDVEQKATEPR